MDSGVKVPELAARLDGEGVKPPQTDRWRTSFLYSLIERHRWHAPRHHNERPHNDEELKARIVELRGRGHTYAQIAGILNEQKWVPLKGRKFTEGSVGKLLRTCDETKYKSPKRYLDNILEKRSREHATKMPGEPFQRPGLPKLATLRQPIRANFMSSGGPNFCQKVIDPAVFPSS